MENLDKFEKDIAMYEKIVETVEMIIIANRSHAGRLGDDYFAHKILKNLEEIQTIPYKATIGQLVKYKEDYKNYLIDRYKGDSKKTSRIYAVDKRDWLIEEDDKKEKFNLVSFMTLDSSDWFKTLLTSRLSLKNRSCIYIDALKYDDKYFTNTFADSYKDLIYVICLFIKMEPGFKRQLFDSLIRERPYLIGELQEKGYVDFSQVYGNAYDTLSKLISNSSTKSSFDIIYNTLSDSEKQEVLPGLISIRSNNKNTVFNMVEDLNFKVTPEIIEALRIYTMDNDGKLDYYDKDFDAYRNIVADKLVRKAHNKKEYKEYKKLAQDYLDKTDYKKQLEQEMIERKKIAAEQKIKKLELLSKRHELSTFLYNLNDKLQEEVPGKTIIKNINFKK